MQRLEGLLGESLVGHGRIVTLCGEPGIGKTRIAEELCSIARSRGADAAWGSCYEGEGAPLYWPWSLVMRDLLQARGTDAVRRHLGAGAPVVAEAISAIAEALPELPAPKPIDNPAMARFRVFDALAAFFRRTSADRPMVMVLDDLHWADEPSLLLLSFLCRDVAGAKMLLIGTYRGTEAKRKQLLEQTLGDLARERGYEQFAVGRLDREAVRRYLAAVRGHDPSTGLADLIYDRTDGSPFFVTEVARLIKDDPRGPEGTIRDIPLPETVREVTGRRLDRLSARCRDLLAVAAVIGREFDARTLAAARGDAGAGDLLALLDEGIASGLVEPAGDHGGHYRFGHVLTQQALLARLAPGELAQLHARVVEALERKYGDRIDAHAREFVEHLGPAQAVLGTGKLIHYLAIAGQQALESYAWEEARDLFSRAIALRAGESEDEQAADLYFGLCRAQSALMDSGAVDNGTRAFDLYRRLGRVERAVAVVGSGLYVTTEQWPGWVGMADKALAMVEKGSLEEPVVITMHASSSTSISTEERQRQLENALDIARRKGVASLEMMIMVRLSRMSQSNCDFAASADWALKAYQLALREGDLYHQCDALGQLIEIKRAMGLATNTSFSRESEEYRVLAEKLHDHRMLVFAYMACARAAMGRADWPNAREMNDRCLSLTGSNRGQWVDLCHRAAIEYQTRNFDAGEKALAEIMHIAESLPLSWRTYTAHYAAMLAMLSERSSNLDVVERWLHDIVSDEMTWPMNRNMAHLDLGIVAVLKGDGDAAAAAYDHLLQARERDEAAGTTSSDPGTFLALFARTAGRMDEAVRHLHESADLCERTENTCWLMWSLFYLAETLLQRSRRGDREEAERILERLVPIAVSTGTGLVEDRARALLERTGIAPGTAARSQRPDGLTDREIEVLRLVAAGRTNKEIGRQLYISTTTVNAHVRNVLEKIGAANRAEAATYAAKQGLSEP